MIIKPVSQHQILSIHDDQPVLSIEERRGIWLKKENVSRKAATLLTGRASDSCRYTNHTM